MARRSATLGAGWAVTALLGGLLVWAPLFFASITRGGQVIVQVGAFLILAIAILSGLPLRPLGSVALPLVAVTAIGLLGLAQSLPWGAAVVSRLSPEHARLYHETSTRLAIASRPTLSLAPGASRATALTWLAAAAVLASAAIVGRERAHRRALGLAVLASACLQVLYGARHLYSGSTTMWGLEIASSTHLRGTFVNPDQSATYLLLGLSLAFAAFWLGLERARDTPLDRRLLLVAPPALVWLTLFVALAFTGSRGGMLAATFGAVTQGALLAAGGRGLRSAPSGAVAVVLGLAAVAGVGFQQGLGKWMASSSGDASWASRVRVYGLSLELWTRFPLTGSGLGTFRDAFPLVQPTDLAGAWWHAHSDCVEMLATTGLLGAGIAVAGILGLVARLARILRGPGPREDKAAALAALGCVAGVGLHEAVDFGLAMPATAITLAALCGAAAAAHDST